MTGAAITASVAVVVAVVTQIETWRRARADRRYARQRAALIDVQDAALVVRREYRRFGRQVEAGVVRGTLAEEVTIGSTTTLDDARGRLEVTAVRVDERREGGRVGVALTAWQVSAADHFLSPADLTTGTEEAAWRELNRSVTKALRAA